MKRLFIVLSVLVAIAWLCASSEAVIIEDPCQPEGSTVPTCCTFVNSNGDPYYFDGRTSPTKLEVKPEGENNEWPVWDTVLQKWRWQYKVYYRPTPPWSFNITTLAPMCYPNITTSAFSWHWPFPILENILSGTIFKLYPDFDSPEIVWFYTDEQTPVGRTSLQMNIGYNTYFCRDIQGPVCPGYVPESLPLNFVPLNTAEYKKLGDNCLRITRDNATWCIIKIEKCTAFDSGTTCNGTNCTAWEEIPPVQQVAVDEEVFVSCTTLDGNQKCQECIIYSESLPGEGQECFYTYSSGATTWKISAGCQ